MRLLVVEDDEILLDGLKTGLMLFGFTVDTVSTVGDAQLAIKQDRFDAIILDLMLPDGSGLDILRCLREEEIRTPVLLLTARDTVRDRIDGLDAGADDYLGKPFDLDELAARLRAITRRISDHTDKMLHWQGLSLDSARMIADVNGQEVTLSRREFAILQALMRVPGIVLSKSSLEEKLYGWEEEVESNTIEVHIHKLRAKIGRSYIQTIRGLGYRMRRED